MDDETLEQEVREALMPAPVVVEQMVTTALCGVPPKRHFVPFALVAAGLTALVVAAVLLGRHEPPPASGPAVVLTNVGPTVIATPETGTVWLSGGRDEEKLSSLPSGTLIVFGPGGTP